MYISADSCYSCILNLINKRNPTAFAITEVTESELEDDNLRLEQFLDSEFVLTADMKQNGRNCRRERGVSKQNFDDMVYY